MGLQNRIKATRHLFTPPGMFARTYARVTLVMERREDGRTVDKRQYTLSERELVTALKGAGYIVHQPDAT